MDKSLIKCFILRHYKRDAFYYMFLDLVECHFPFYKTDNYLDFIEKVENDKYFLTFLIALFENAIDSDVDKVSNKNSLIRLHRGRDLAWNGMVKIPNEFLGKMSLMELNKIVNEINSSLMIGVNVEGVTILIPQMNNTFCFTARSFLYSEDYVSKISIEKMLMNVYETIKFASMIMKYCHK